MARAKLQHKKVSTFDRLRMEVVADEKIQQKPKLKKNVQQEYRLSMNMIAQKYEKETLEWLDKVERTGTARRDVRRALYSIMHTKSGKRRQDFSTIRQDIARIERIKSLPGNTNVIAFRDFKSGSGVAYYSEKLPTLYIEKKKGDTNAKAMLREFSKNFRAYQKELKQYKAEHGSYRGFPRGTGTALPQHLLIVSRRFPEVFQIGDTSDIIGTFKINQGKFSKYKGNSEFEMFTRNLLGFAPISKIGLEAKREGEAAEQARLARRYPNTAKVVAMFTAAGVNLGALRDILNSNKLSGYFMGYLGYDSEQYRKSRVICRTRVVNEAENPTIEKDADGNAKYAFMPIDAKAFNEFISLVDKVSANWNDTTSGAKLQDWFEEHVGEAYFLS